MTALPWLLAAAEALALSVIAGRGWRRTGSLADVLAEVPPSPDQIAEVTRVLKAEDDRHPNTASFYQLAMGITDRYQLTPRTVKR